MESVERNEVTPLCPYCEQGVSTIHHRSVKAFWGRRYVYFCPNCSRILGVSHRKGFWMG